MATSLPDQDQLQIHLGTEFRRDELLELRRSGALERVRVGCYAKPMQGDEHQRRDLLAFQRMAAVVARFSTSMCLSHESAAFLYGWPLMAVPSLTHITQAVNARARNGSDTVRHRCPLPDSDRSQVRDLPVTSPERTALDCIRTFRPDAGLMLLDRALRQGVSAGNLQARIAKLGGHRGIARARDLLALADPAAESPGESRTRYRIHQTGLPLPQLQYRVDTDRGTFRLDMAWPSTRVGLEFDGLVKYTRLAQGDPSAVVVAEKQRQEALERAGWRIVRIGWADLQDSHTLRQLLQPHLQPLTP